MGLAVAPSTLIHSFLTAGTILHPSCTLCMHLYVCIYGHICAYMGHMCAHVGECVPESCAVQLAACDCKYPESAHLLASHSLPTVSDLRNSFFSAFGTSKIGGGGTFMGGWAPCASKFKSGPLNRLCHMYIWHMFTNVSTKVQGHRGGLGWGVGTPPPYFGVGKHKKTCFRSELGGY